MSLVQHPDLSNQHLRRLQQVQGAIDDTLDARSRLNRKLRQLRDAKRSLEDGVIPPLLDDLLDLPTSAEPSPVPRLMSQGEPTMRVAPPIGHFGAPMPGEEFPGMTGPPTRVPSRLDVGTLQQLSEGELDGLPFGVVTLDHRGVVVGYNDTESRMVGLPRDAVLGRSFFGDVAPCAKVRAFEGRFQDLVRSATGFPMTSFDFVFRFESGAQHVSILISPARHRGRFHVSMFRR